MNLAILIGVSEYQNVKSLNACKNDIGYIYKLLQATNKYSEILYIESDTTSINVKNKIIDFLKKYIDSNEMIDELFFYYSGHGMVLQDEFHYVLSDYDSKWINKTTYMNSELDNLLRSLKPKLTVKIVDACYSGVKYIKDLSDTEVKKAIELSIDKLDNCYFMYSSQNDEVSRATNVISFFTKSFIDSITNSNINNIRYRDIIDYISDSFSQESTGQTPYFVMQSNNTELFGSISDAIKKEIQESLVKIGAADIDNTKNEKMEGVTLIDKIKFDVSEYCKDIAEVQGVFEKIKILLEEKTLESQIEELFNLDLEFLDTYYDENDIEELNKVAASLKDQEELYFIKLEYKKKKVRVKKSLNPYTSVWNNNNDDDEYVEKEKEVLVGYNLTEQNIPYTLIRLTLLPKPQYPNLKKYRCNILFAFSKVYIKMIFNRVKYREVSFDEYTIQELKWNKSKDIFIKDENTIEKSISNIQKLFEKFVLDDLYIQFDVNHSSTEHLKEEVTN